MSSPQPTPQPTPPESGQTQPKKTTESPPAPTSTIDEAALQAIGKLIDAKVGGLAAQLAEALKALPEVVRNELSGLQASCDNFPALASELADKVSTDRLREQREMISRSDTLTAEVLACETDDEDLLVRFDVSLLRKDGTALKRVRGHSTLMRAMSDNGLSEAPQQLEGDLRLRIVRPLVGALQQAVTEALLPPDEDELLPALLPPVEEPQTPSAEQGDRLQSDPGASGAGSDLH